MQSTTGAGVRNTLAVAVIAGCAAPLLVAVLGGGWKAEPRYWVVLAVVAAATTTLDFGARASARATQAVAHVAVFAGATSVVRVLFGLDSSSELAANALFVMAALAGPVALGVRGLRPKRASDGAAPPRADARSPSGDRGDDRERQPPT